MERANLWSLRGECVVMKWECACVDTHLRSVSKRRKVNNQDSTRFRLGLIQDVCVCVEQEITQGEGWIGDAGGDVVRRT